MKYADFVCPKCSLKQNHQTELGITENNDQSALIFICTFCFSINVFDKEKNFRRLTLEEKMYLQQTDPKGFSLLLFALHTTIKYMERKKSKLN